MRLKPCRNIQPYNYTTNLNNSKKIHVTPLCTFNNLFVI